MTAPNRSLLNSHSRVTPRCYIGRFSSAACVITMAMVSTSIADFGGFAPQQSVEVGTDPRDIASGDFNGNGNVDLAVVNWGSSDVSILLGNGDGTFSQQQTYDVGSNAARLAAGDLNGNDWLDLVVANEADHTISILLGNGDGTFAAQQTVAVAGGPHAVAIGDLNNDGNPDVVVTALLDNSIAVLLGNGDGTFATPQTYSTGAFPEDVIIADLNGNGILDLATSNTFGFGDDVSVFLGNGDGTFQSQVTYLAENDFNLPSRLAAGDLNNNGFIDLAVTTSNNVVSLLFGNGDGTFQAPDNLVSVGSVPLGVAIGDVDLDGQPDLVVASQGNNTIGVVLGNGDGTFQPEQAFEAGQNPRMIVLADLTGSGAPDVVAPNRLSNDISVFINLTEANGSCPEDFNGDGVIDVSDLLFLLSEWGRCGDPEKCPADLNGDGTVGVTDLLAVLGAWGECP